MSDEIRQLEVSRTIDVPAERVFAHLARADNHAGLDASGMVRGSADHRVLSGVGQVFVMNMHSAAKGDYRVENHVVVHEPGRALGWAPARPGDPPAGHTFVWRLTPDGDRTVVSQTYDWSEFTHLDQLSRLPVVGRDQLQSSLDRLAEAVEDARDQS